MKSKINFNFTTDIPASNKKLLVIMYVVSIINQLTNNFNVNIYNSTCFGFELTTLLLIC